MSILPVAVLPTRSVQTAVNLLNPLSGYALVRYENIAGAFSLSTLSYADIVKPPDPPPFQIIQLGIAWRALIIIRSFDATALDSFGTAIKRRKFGYYHGGYADLNAEIHYVNFERQLTRHYCGYVNEDGFANWSDNFPTPLPPATAIYTYGNIGISAYVDREFAVLLKGEFTKSVIADIYISAVYNWLVVTPFPAFAVVDV